MLIFVWHIVSSILPNRVGKKINTSLCNIFVVKLIPHVITNNVVVCYKVDNEDVYFKDVNHLISYVYKSLPRILFFSSANVSFL